MCELSENVICMLCGDYLVDAVTLTECLHFFCRSCLLDHLKKENRCPKCFQDLGPDLSVAFRRDDLLQRFVYKLVPDVLWRELQRRRRRDAARQQRGGTLSSRRAAKTRKMATMARMTCRPDERISLVVEYVSASQILDAKLKCEPTVSNSIASQSTPTDGTTFRRYFRCSASTKIEHLRKLLELKLAVAESYAIQFVCERLSIILDDDLSLQELIGMSGWDRRQSFRIIFTLSRQTQVDEEEDRPPVLDVEAPQARERLAPSATGSETSQQDKGLPNSSTSVDASHDDGNGTPPAIPRLSITLSTSALTGRTTPGAYHPIITTMQTNLLSGAPNNSSSGAPTVKSRKRRNVVENGASEDKTPKSSKTVHAKNANANTAITGAKVKSEEKRENLMPKDCTIVGTSANKSEITPPPKNSPSFTKQQPPKPKDIVISQKSDKTQQQPFHQAHPQQKQRSQQQQQSQRKPSCPTLQGNSAVAGPFGIPPPSSPSAAFHMMQMNPLFGTVYSQISPSTLTAAGFPTYSAGNGNGVFPPTPTSTNSPVISSLSPQQLANYYWEMMLSNGGNAAQMYTAAAAAAASNPYLAASLYKSLFSAGLSPPTSASRNASKPLKSTTSGGNVPPSPKKSRKDGPVQRLSADGVPIPSRNTPSASQQQRQLKPQILPEQQKEDKKSRTQTVKMSEENADEFIDVQSMDLTDETATTTQSFSATTVKATVALSTLVTQKTSPSAETTSQNGQKLLEPHQNQNRPKPVTTLGASRQSTISILKTPKPPTSAGFDVDARFLSAISNSAGVQPNGGTTTSKPTLAN